MSFLIFPPFTAVLHFVLPSCDINHEGDSENEGLLNTKETKLVYKKYQMKIWQNEILHSQLHV